MKKLLISLIALGSVYSYGNSVCVAEKINSGVYSLVTKYLIHCSDQSTPYEIRGGLFPKERLVKEMKKRGYAHYLELELEDKHPRADRRPYRVFTKRGHRLSRVCALNYGNKKYVHYVGSDLYDFLITCNDTIDDAEYIGGDKRENIQQLMKNRGFEQVLDFTPRYNGFYSLKKEKVVVGKTIIYLLD